MNKFIAFTLLAICFIAYIIFSTRMTKVRAIDHFKQFNSENLKGEIEYFDARRGGVLFKLKGKKVEYEFCPGIVLHGNKVFEDIAAKGDSIVKATYSDTLRLIKKDQVFLFTFWKANYK